MSLIKINKNLRKFKENYIKHVSETKVTVEKNLLLNNKFYIENMRMIASLAKKNKIKVIFIIELILYEAKNFKKLVGHELSEYIHSQTSYFSLPIKKIESLNKIESHMIDNKYYWNLDQYVSGYAQLRENLHDLCAELEVKCLNVNDAIKNKNDKAIFSSPFHYTYVGAEILGLGISDFLTKNNEYFSLY